MSYQETGIFGSEGIGDGQFEGIGGIAVDATGNVYVSDILNKRIEKFTAAGSFLTAWSTPDGREDGIAVCGSTVYGTDFCNAQIREYSTTGTPLLHFSTHLADEFSSEPHDVAVDSEGNVWVDDMGVSTVKKFAPDGTYLLSLPRGGGSGQLSGPDSLDVDAANNVYVVDDQQYQIKKFTSSGAYVTGRTSTVAGDADLLEPIAIALDHAGNIYVGDLYLTSLQADVSVKKFDSSLTFQTRIGTYATTGQPAGTYSDAAALAVGPNGTVYVADSTLSRVEMFAPKAGNRATRTTLSAPSSVKAGKSVTLSGTVSPSTAAGKVTIARYRKVGTKWEHVGSVTVSVKRGSFRHVYTSTVRGTWGFVAHYGGGGGYAASTSASRILTVK